MVSETTALKARQFARRFDDHLWLLSNKTFTEDERAYLAYLFEEMYKAGKEG